MSKMKLVAPWSKAGYVKLWSNGNRKIIVAQCFWDELLSRRGGLFKKNDGLSSVTALFREAR